MKRNIIIVSSLLLVFLGIFLYFKFRFKLEITLSEVRNVEFGVPTNLKDFIESSNGVFEDDIETFYELGDSKVTLKYKDTYDKVRKYSFDIKVVDSEKPIILANSVVTSYVNEEANPLKNVICADYVSSNVLCEIEGSYDVDTLGSYNLKYKATDESGNIEYQDFVLNIIPKPAPTKSTKKSEPNYVYFTDVLNQYKNDNTLIGLDVSRFQGNIDFNKVRAAGADFVIIRLGWYVDSELGLDYNYEKYIADAYNAGLKIGLYFYSEARTKDEINKITKFINDNIHYKIDLPIAYDWEDFNNYNSYKLSLYEFNKLSYQFMDQIKEYGYSSILYGSKYYLTKMWIPEDYDVWLAQYYKEVTYEGKYKIWQITDNGKIDGINSTVDINIYYN